MVVVPQGSVPRRCGSTRPRVDRSDFSQSMIAANMVFCDFLSRWPTLKQAKHARKATLEAERLTAPSGLELGWLYSGSSGWGFNEY